MDRESRKHNIDYDIITKYIAGEATPDEKTFVEDWISKSEENREIFDQLITVWHDTGSIPKESISQNLDMNDAWKKIQSKITVVEDQEKQVVAKTPLKRWLSIAAAVLIIVVGANVITLFGGEDDPLISKIEAADVQKEVTLPDGSLVSLNVNSSISYASNFNETSREILLEGEAFFNVTHDGSRPFIVNAGETSITVLGTKFNVVKIQDSISVFLESGKVVFGSGKSELVLAPGELASFSPKKRLVEVSDHSAVNPLYWKNKILSYNAAPLSVVIKNLNSVFDQNISIDSNDLKNCPFSATFKDEKLETILEILSSSFDIQIKRDSSSIHLYGEGC